MSGHSHWATTQRKKSSVDAKRSALFTKLAKNITVAAKSGGGDPEFNFQLRMAVDQAKAGNLPKDNIEKAIKKGTGEIEGEQLEEIIYEGFGPEKTAFIIEVITDNKNRSSSEIKHLFTKYGGCLGEPSSVMWMFDRKGVILLPKPAEEKKDLSAEALTKAEEVEMKIIESGARDFKEEPEFLAVYTKPEELMKVKENLEKQGIQIESALLEYVSKEDLKINEEAKGKIEKFYEALDEHPDVSNYYTNASL